MTIFAVPYAGGNSYCYRDLAGAVGTDTEWNTLELPGRGKRIREPLLNSIENLAEDVLAQIMDHGVREFSLFGHSMGGLVAHRVVEMLEERFSEKIVVRSLFVSGCRSPCSFTHRTKRAELSRAELIREVDKLGGLPEPIKEDTELMAFFEPILRADFGAVDQYAREGTGWIRTPIIVFSGEDDPEVSAEQVIAWKQASNEVRFFLFSGGHFFFQDHVAEFAAILVENTAPQGMA